MAASKIKKLLRKQFARRKTALLSVAAVIVIGAGIFAATRAAGPFISAEPENGSLGTATLVSDSGASGGSAVKFGAAGVNILAGKQFTSNVADSAAESGPISNLTDDNDNTRWISNATRPVTATVDMAGNYTLSKVQVVWAADTIKNYTLSVSSDGNSWTTIASGATDNTQKQDVSYTSFSAAAKGRYLRITGTDAWNAAWGNSIWEVRAYGNLDSPVPPPPPTPPTPPTPPSAPTGIISIAFDDGPVEQYNNAVPALNARGFKGTFFLIANLLNSGGYINPTQAKAMVAQGHEIGSHSKAHDPNMASWTYAQVDADYSGGQDMFQAALGFKPKTCGYPYGAYNATIDSVVRKYFRGCRSSAYDQIFASTVNVYNMPNYAMGATSNAATVQQLVDRSVQQKSWVIITFHQVGSSGDLNVSTATFNAMMDVIKNSGIKVLTVDQALTAIGK